MSRAVKMLLRQGWITKEQFEQAMVLSARHGETPGYHLVQMGAIADEDLVDFFVKHFTLRFWPKFRIKDIPESTIQIITPALAKHLRVIPILLAGQNLTLGLTDPSMTHVAEEAGFHTKRFINPVLISESDMTWALDRYYQILPQKAGADSAPKPPAVLLRETHDIIPSELSRQDEQIQAVINVTDNGWDIDEWGVADVYPDDDDDDPAHLNDSSHFSGEGRRVGGRPAEPERLSIFSLPAKPRNTLPPPVKPSTFPAVRQSIASMMLASPRHSGEASRITMSKFNSRSTVDLLIPKSIQESRVEGDSGKTTGEIEIPKKTISEIIDAIHRSSDRNEIIRFALDFLLLFTRRAAFLLVKKDEIRGYDIKGEETNLAAIRSYWIPYDSESTFRKVAEERQIHLGPFGRTVSDAVFSAALGGRPHRVLIIPVVIQDRVAGLLYADKLRIDMPPWNLLERIAEVTGASLYRLLMNRRQP